nr:EOG090X01LO [Scapholeberis mucronata]
MFYDDFDSTNDDKIDDLTSSNVFADPKFERQERLDVKKPGPLFNVNNFAFKSEENSENNFNHLPALSKKIFKDVIAFKEEQKSLPLIQPASRSSSENPKVDYYSDDLKDEMRQTIQQKTGLELIATGIGDQSGVSSILYWGQENQQLLLAIGLCLLVTATLVTAMVIFLLRKRQVSRQKLKDLTQSIDTEATRDYQDLCRTRMAIKSSTSETIKDSTKIAHTHISRDSESSRSSTSSWCEEPVLTNMDISTGHMVLSYMEDHLRNKFRLEQEWLALCSYEAEPSTSILTASKPENIRKNRYEDALPYDHSRVILNALANVNGLDYINASLITDHDPRHPAYIAAQSPVAESVADFWQMIWEQGCAVLVLLTRTNENGKNLCFKYWPEEGSQLYHIYEVHLVSEHIWCDDYLVRSFYLKNVRTSETRTVTQFHFQSWAENGIPTSTKALLEFRRKVNKSYRGRSCPIVVHCSDGAGRTGTYCLIDMVLHRMSKGSREIDIAATLEHLRDQRAQAVRNKQQFEFVLTAVAEEVHAILRALPQ